MAHLVRPWIVSYQGADGKRVPKGTPGAKTVRERAAKWYGQGLPNLPPKKRVPLATNKAAAQRMLNKMVEAAEQGAARMPDRDAGRVPLAEYLPDFEGDVKLGLEPSPKRRGRRRLPEPKQVRMVVSRVRAVLDGCGLKNPSDLTDAAASKVARFLAGRRELPKTEGGMSAQTAEFHVAAIRRFARWLSKKCGVRADLFDVLPSFDAANNRVHARREVSPEELQRLFDAAHTSRNVLVGLTGVDRQHLYLAAFATGYRAYELSELRPESFHLDADPPAVSLPGRITKYGTAVRPPLAPAAAVPRRAALKGPPAGKPVWPGGWVDKPAEILRSDLKRANVPYVVEGPEGKLYADFHALRHTYLSSLAAAGVGVKELQTLARHSTPTLTFGIYTHARVDAVAGAAAKLPVPGAEPPGPFAHLTRGQLETALALCLGLLAVKTRSGT